MINRIIKLGLSAILFTSCGGSKEDIAVRAFKKYNVKFVILVSKKNFSLTVFERNNRTVASYKIGYGSNEDMLPKLHEGDDRTPEGEYQITEILSMDSAKDTESYRKLKKMNEFYFKKTAGYHKYKNPDEDLGDNAYGPRYYALDYPNKQDEERYKKALSSGEIHQKNGKAVDIGSGIAIHGNNDEESIGHLCSSGCIRMYNNDIVELERYISLGTPVLIEHD